MVDGGLIRSAGQGDERAFGELVRRLAPGIHRFLAGMLGDGHDATDATEETFVRMARSISRFDADDAEAWAYGLARRVGADRILWRTATGPGPLGALPHHHREVLVMRETLEWDPQRMARILETTIDDVRARLYAARDALLPSTLPQPEESAVTREVP